jgi:subtilisin family serine protease
MFPSTVEFLPMTEFKTHGLRAAIVAGFVAAVVAAPAFAAPDQGSRVIVKFKAGALAQGKAEVAKRGGTVLVDLSEVDALAVRVSPKALAALKASRNVEFVEADHPQYAFGITPASETVPYGITMVQADQTSDAGAGNRKLCIIDSGIDGTHPDLQGIPMAGQNFTTSGVWNSDELGHGTHVAGTIAAVGGNGIGVVGVAPHQQLNLYIAKVFDATGSASSSTVAKAMLACSKAGANVISMSLGSGTPNQLQKIVVRVLAGRNVLMVAAAGNAGTSAISYPAGFPEVISVAAIDGAKNKASFSQFNADVEIAAPGVGVLSTVPVGTGIELRVVVGGVTYGALPMAGTPGAVATAALYNFGLGTAVDNGASGKVCLIQRGNIAFSDKVLNCQNSGGVAAIIYNNIPGPLNGTLNNVPTLIPSIGVSDVDGASMLAVVGRSATVDTANQFITDYAYYDGTSMATPHAASVAAVVWSQNPTCTAAQLRTSLNNSALDLGTVGRDDNYGFGLIQGQAANLRIASLGCGV